MAYHRLMELDIAKIDDEIERLQALKRLASDPRMAELFERFASNNGSQQFVVTESSTPSVAEEYSRGDLLRTVQQTCQLFEGQFTSSDVIAKMPQSSSHAEKKSRQKVCLRADLPEQSST